MSITSRMDTRTLRTFYPDPAKRHEVHYVFAHRFLPFFIYRDPRQFFAWLLSQDIPGGTVDLVPVIHSLWTLFEAQSGLFQAEADPVNGRMALRCVSELTLSLQVVADKPVALVQMPNPEQELEAYFVAAVLLASPADPMSWPSDVEARVFTLESEGTDAPGAGQIGVFCEWTKDGEHRNYGVHAMTEQDVFLRHVAAALQARGAPVASMRPP